MKVLFLLSFLFLGTILTVSAEGETLVLLDSLATRETHSIFFKNLQGKNFFFRAGIFVFVWRVQFSNFSERGYKISYKLADDASLVLSKHGEFLYQNLVIFAPETEEFGGDLNVEKITEFIDNGGNVLVAGNSKSGASILELASECGFEVDEEDAAIIDHLNYE